MFLQATVDAADLVEARRLLDIYQEIPEIDIIEMGAPMVSHYGVKGAKWFLERVSKPLYVDTKMIDFPTLELMPFIDVGARHFSAMAVMNNGAFKELRELMHEYPDMTVLVSLMGYPLDRIKQRLFELQVLGFNSFIAHGAGVTSADAFDDLDLALEVLDYARAGDPNIIVAGGINEHNVAYLGLHDDVAGVIVGRGIAKSLDPRRAVLTIKAALTDAPDEDRSARRARAERLGIRVVTREQP